LSNFWGPLHIFVQELNEGATALDVLKGSKLADNPGFEGVFGEAGQRDLQPIWAPDGKSIVFAAYEKRDRMMMEELESELYVVPATGGEPKAITTSGSSYEHPKFSPKGDLLYAETEVDPIGWTKNRLSLDGEAG